MPSPARSFSLALTPNEMAYLKRLLYLEYEARVFSVISAGYMSARDKTNSVIMAFRVYRIMDGIVTWTSQDADGHAYREVGEAELDILDRIYREKEAFLEDEMLKDLQPYTENVGVTLNAARKNETTFSFVHNMVGKA